MCLRFRCVITCDVALDGSLFWPNSGATKRVGSYNLANRKEEEFPDGMYVR